MAHLHALKSFDSDPVLMEVQRNLSMGGGEISSIVTSGGAPTGSEIMSLVHLMASGQSHAAPVTTQAKSPSSLGPALGAGVAGLAVGAGAAALASSGKGGPKTPAVAKSTGDQPPGPPAEIPVSKGTSAATKPTPPPGGSSTVPEPPTKAPVGPNIYSGFEEPELGKGTQIVLGKDYSNVTTIDPVTVTAD